MSRRILNEEERVEERRLFIDGNYPYYPILCVKRDAESGHGLPEVGLVIHRNFHKNGVAVYLVNFFELNERAKRYREANGMTENEPVTYGQIFEGVETLNYDNLEDFFDDGWRGD
jgi:hypothetical protein